MKDFHHWLNEQGRGETEEVDDVLYFRCYACGKEEHVSRAEYDNGDTGWHINENWNDPDEPTRVGVCGGSPRCLP